MAITEGALRTRHEEGGTPAPEGWGIDSEYGVLRDVLLGLGCNVVALGNDRVLSVAQSEDLNARLRALGFTVYGPDMSMFLQAGGGVHCMCQPLRREPA